MVRFIPKFFGSCAILFAEESLRADILELDLRVSTRDSAMFSSHLMHAFAYVVILSDHILVERLMTCWMVEHLVTRPVLSKAFFSRKGLTKKARYLECDV